MTETVQETLENCIHLIQKTSESNIQMSNRKKIRMISKIVKHFSEYAKDTDTLPPQTLIPCCLFVLPKQLSKLLQLKENQPLEDRPENKALDILLQTYLKSIVKLLQKSQQQIKHVIIEGISKSIYLAVPYEKTIKKLMKILIDLWGTEYTNINLGLRAFIAFNKYLQIASDENFMWALRRIYISYFENSKQVSWRNLEHVNFMINCFCEICKINDGRTYYVLFGYIRNIALQITKLNKTKRRQKIQLTNKLYSNQILNCFRLFTSVVSRVNSQQLSALIYPLIELTISYEKISYATQFIPLKLHLLTFLLNVMESTNVFIPSILTIIENLLKNKLFVRKAGKKVEKVGGDLELSYKYSPTDLTNTTLINETFDSIIHKFYWLISLSSKITGGSEIIKKSQNILKQLSYSFSGYKVQISDLIKLTRNDSYELYNLRASKHLSLLQKNSNQIIEKILSNQELSCSQKYSQIKEERQQMLKKKLLAQNQDGEKMDEDEASIQEDEDQLNSGWQEADSGASQFQDQQKEQLDDSDQSKEQQQKEDVSYEGDPDSQEADEAVKQWQEQQWDSQDQI